MKHAFKKFAILLPGTLAETEGEFIIWKTHWNGKPRPSIPCTAIDALNACQQFTFPNIFLLLKIFATLPVSSCELERLFSKVQRTLTAIRSTMSEDRLESLILLQAFRDDLPDTEAVINKFAAARSRRLNFAL